MKQTRLLAAHGATSLKAAVELSAEAVDSSTRTITGVVVPYGVVGNTSIGPVTIVAGSLAMPEDLRRVKLFSGHNRENPIGYALSAEDTADDLSMVFKIAQTPAGDLALAEADGGVRDALSVELDQLVLDETETEVTSGYVRGVALIPIPAFDDARVTQVAASHTNGDTMKKCKTCGREHAAEVTCAQYTETLAAQASPAASAPGGLPSPAGGAGGVAPAAAPGGMQAAAGRRPMDAITDLDTFYAALASRSAPGSQTPDEMLAALYDITYANNTGIAPPQWVDQLWQGVGYQRKIIPLLGGPKSLTSYVVNGWRWVAGKKPEVAAYAGNKTDVPSNEVDTEAATANAVRLAGAHDFDRKFVDFGDVGFIRAYFEAMTDSYARKSDAAAAAAIVAGATDEAAPDYEGFLGAIAAGVSAIEDETDANSTFVLVNKGDLIPWVLGLTGTSLAPRDLLEAIGIDLARLKTSAAVTAGHVIVGTSAAMDYYELPGSPIRVEAVDLAKGGVDEGVFGYYATLVNSALGLIDVVIDTGA